MYFPCKLFMLYTYSAPVARMVSKKGNNLPIKQTPRNWNEGMRKGMIAAATKERLRRVLDGGVMASREMPSHV